MSSRSTTARSRDVVSFLLQCHDSRGCGGVCLRIFVLLATAGSLIYSGCALVYCLHNIHVRFWLGDVVIICMALYLTALLPATIMLAYKIYINAHRRSQKDHTKSMMGRGGIQDDFSWRISIRTLRFILMLITMLSTIAAVLAYIVVSAGLETSGSLLLECGKSSNGKSLEQVNEKLREFASSSQCSDAAPLDQCHGFAKAFPPPSPWATYTKVLETELDCGGWCKKEPALFRTDTEKGSEACATNLGRHLWCVAAFTGVPTLVSASILAMLGFVLYSYDGL